MEHFIISGGFHNLLAFLAAGIIGAMFGTRLPKEIANMSTLSFLIGLVQVLVVAAAIVGIIYQTEIMAFKSKG
jgi:uncharacterized membrane protein YqgA involved in biofilm formation